MSAIPRPVGAADESDAVEPAPADFVYVLEVPDGTGLAYTIPIEIDQAGTLHIDAEWPVARVLSFRLESPDGSLPALRRSGPPPQSLSVEIEDGDPLGRWTLSIRGLSGRGGGEGRVRIRLPAPEPEEPEKPAAGDSKPTPARSPRKPAGRLGSIRLPEGWESVRRAARRMDEVLGPVPYQDSCRWQMPFAQWQESVLQGLASGEAPSEPVRRSLEEIVAAIEAVEGLREPTDPILAGPPSDPSLVRAWVRVRRDRIDAIQRKLDDTAGMLARGHAPELDQEEWPGQLVDCVTACERHFEERTRLGEDGATNRDLARQQWDRILAAADLLKALAAGRTKKP